MKKVITVLAIVAVVLGAFYCGKFSRVEPVVVAIETPKLAIEKPTPTLPAPPTGIRVDALSAPVAQTSNTIPMTVSAGSVQIER